jgi:hypothetical protein
MSSVAYPVMPRGAVHPMRDVLTRRGARLSSGLTVMLTHISTAGAASAGHRA